MLTSLASCVAVGKPRVAKTRPRPRNSTCSLIVDRLVVSHLQLLLFNQTSSTFDSFCAFSQISVLKGELAQYTAISKGPCKPETSSLRRPPSQEVVLTRKASC